MKSIVYFRTLVFWGFALRAGGSPPTHPPPCCGLTATQSVNFPPKMKFLDEPLYNYNMVLNLPATISLVVLLFPPPPLFLHVTSTIVVNITVNLNVSIIGKLEVITLHRTVLYGPEDLGIPVGELNR